MVIIIVIPVGIAISRHAASKAVFPVWDLFDREGNPGLDSTTDRQLTIVPGPSGPAAGGRGQECMRDRLVSHAPVKQIYLFFVLAKPYKMLYTQANGNTLHRVIDLFQQNGLHFVLIIFEIFFILINLHMIQTTN